MSPGRSRRVLDQAERMRMYREADKILVEELPILPLSYGRFHMLMKPWVKKLFKTPLKWWSWTEMILEPHSLTNTIPSKTCNPASNVSLPA